MQIEQMRDYWQRRYAANNLILSVAGNFDWEHIVQLAEEHCSNWRTGDAGRDVEHYEPAHAINDIVVDKKLKQQIMILAMPSVDVKTPITTPPSWVVAFWAMAMAHACTGISIRKGLAESASASIWAMEGTGILMMQANSTPEEAPRVLKMLRANSIAC